MLYTSNGAFLIFTLQGLSRRDYRQGHLQFVECVHTISTWTSTASALLRKLDTSSAKVGNSLQSVSSFRQLSSSSSSHSLLVQQRPVY